MKNNTVPHLLSSPLNVLIGSWNAEGVILDGNSNETGIIKGTDIYEWACGGAFILHRVNVLMDKKDIESIEMISANNSEKKFSMHSFDNNGSSILMYLSIDEDGIFKINADTMKAKLTISNDGNFMIAHWKQLKNGDTWISWMDIKFTKKI